MVEKIMKWHSVTKWLLPAAILVANPALAQQIFPPAGIDNTTSLGKFSLRLNEQAGQAWLGIPDCPWGNSLCLVHSPTLNDSNTKIGRSTPHREDDLIDKDEGARICQNGDNNSCSGYIKKSVKDSDFVFPPLDSKPFDEGPNGIKEIHTQILSLNMTDQGNCGYNLSKDAVRAGINFKSLSPSIGEVEALNARQDFPAESFFNMFVEVDVDLKGFGVKTLYNKEPLVIQNGNLTGFPPQVVYQHDASTTSPLVYDRNTHEEIGWVELAGHGVGYSGCDQASRAAFDSFYEQLVKAHLDKINKECYPTLPQPELKVLGRYDYQENGQSWSRYRLVIANADSFPPALFTPAPHLPSCGLNTSSTRTWVDIYQSSNTGPRLNEFCALNSPSQLKDIWFALPQVQKPPKCLLVELNDRQCDTKYSSNVLCDYPVPLLDEFGNEVSPQPGSSTSGKTTIEVGKGPIDICQLVPSLCQDPQADKFKLTIKLSFPGRPFASELKRPKARDNTTLALSTEQSRAFIESLQASLAQLNLSELVIETDDNISRLEVPIFSAEDPQTPQAWYSMYLGNPVAIESETIPVTGILADSSGLLSFVFVGNDGNYYQSLLIPALHPLIMAAVAETFPEATLTQSPEGIITFSRNNQTTSFRLSYMVTPSGVDLDPLQVNSIDTDGDNQADFLTVSAHGRSQQLELVK